MVLRMGATWMVGVVCSGGWHELQGPHKGQRGRETVVQNVHSQSDARNHLLFVHLSHCEDNCFQELDGAQP